MRQPLIAISLSALLAACAGDAPTDGSTEEEGGDEGGDGSDGEDGFEEPERPATCPEGGMGAVASLIEPEAYDDPIDAEDGPRVRYLMGGINETTGFEIDLYDGYGVFEGAAAPGTYTISGDEADPEACGLCVYLWIDTEEWSYFLQADSGSVTVDTVEGRLKGSASALTFKELGEEGYLEGGCTATVDSVSFDSAYLAADEEGPST